MSSLRLIARVPADKRLEFTQSVQMLLRDQRGVFRGQRILQDVDDRSVLIWLADGDEASLSAFMKSETFHALKGAAEVLGSIEEIGILRDDSSGGD